MSTYCLEVSYESWLTTRYSGTVYACQATFFAWANDAMRYEENTFRGVVIASMNMMSGAVNAWWLIIFYSSSFAPAFTRGMWAMIGTSIALGFWTTGLLWFTSREEKRRLSRDFDNFYEAKKENDKRKAIVD